MSIENNYKAICYCLILLCFSSSSFAQRKPIAHFSVPTIRMPADTTIAHLKVFRDQVVDSISEKRPAMDTLFEERTSDGVPIRYYRHIFSNVCHDGECRPLNLTLYWNITGRYLGFLLSPREYLSKNDHEPFLEYEYRRLHHILTDSLSALSSISYTELTNEMSKEMDTDLDGITGATAKAVLPHIVSGAAYTTYQLWHYVYGKTQTEVKNLTIKSLTPSLVIQILKSTDISDQQWALNHIKDNMVWDEELINMVMPYISDGNYNFAEQALNAINAEALSNPSMQRGLLRRFITSNHSIKRLILNKFKEGPSLNPDVVSQLTTHLSTFGASITVEILDLFEEMAVVNDATTKEVARLLINPNRFVSLGAYRYLSAIPTEDKSIKKQLRQFKRKFSKEIKQIEI